ncbi:MAG: hypothetical protein ACFWTJ_09080 [Lachnoclostridium sp.]|jgi:ABC-2 type transport system permease protein
MISDIWASFYTEAKTRFTTYRILVENFLNPLFILFIFGVAMNQLFGYVKIDETRSIPYIAYFLVGSVNIGLITNCMVSTTHLFLDKYTGLFNYLLSYPIERYSILIGRMLFHVVVSLIQILVMVGFTVWLYPKVIYFNIWFLFFLIFSLISSCGIFCFLFSLSLRLQTQDEFNVLYYLIMTPVTYLSSIYYPISEFPLPLKIISLINPLTWSTDVSRYFLLGMEGKYLLAEGIATVLFFLVSLTVCIRSMQNDKLFLK